MTIPGWCAPPPSSRSGGPGGRSSISLDALNGCRACLERGMESVGAPSEGRAGAEAGQPPAPGGTVMRRTSAEQTTYAPGSRIGPDCTAGCCGAHVRPPASRSCLPRGPCVTPSPCPPRLAPVEGRTASRSWTAGIPLPLDRARLWNARPFRAPRPRLDPEVVKGVPRPCSERLPRGCNSTHHAFPAGRGAQHRRFSLAWKPLRASRGGDDPPNSAPLPAAHLPAQRLDECASAARR